MQCKNLYDLKTLKTNWKTTGYEYTKYFMYGKNISLWISIYAMRDNPHTFCPQGNVQTSSAFHILSVMTTVLLVHAKVTQDRELWVGCVGGCYNIGYPPHTYLNTLRPRQDGRYFADDVLNAFSSMKMFEFRLKFHWSLFRRIQLTIFQQWFR